MWEGLVKTPLGSTPMRKFVSMFATLLVAIFGYTLLVSTPVFAASAEWQDDQIVYLDNTYEGPKTVTSGNIPRVEDNSTYYEFHITQNGLEKAYIIYFTPGLDPPKEQNATLVEYQIIGSSLTGPLSTNDITITPQDSADPDGDSLATGELNSCQIESIGWIVCPATRHIAKGMDYIYGVISEFLEVKPLETTQQGPLYAIWSLARNIANILFVIGFLILIYGQLTGGLASNYMIKKMLPRIIIAALMVNLSYWICAIGIDISNILGYAVQDLFISARNSVTQVPMDPVMWENATEFILTNGTVVAAGGIWTAAGIAATGGSIIAAVYLLIPALLGVVLAALVALIVLAMRQALIVILVIIAPIAFAAYLLPNTEKWFDRWRQTFITMLLLFPIFSLIFGGSQLAGTAIVQTAQSPIIAILGMIVMVAPLVITPMVVKFSGSLLGRIAGMINNPNKGLIDRSRNWSKPRAELHRDKNLARHNTGFHRYGVGRVARRMKRSDITREKRHEGYKKGVENRAHEFEPERAGTNRIPGLNKIPGIGNLPLETQRNLERRQGKTYGAWDEQYRRAEHDHHRIEAHHQAQWDQRFEKGSGRFDAALFAQEAQTRKYARSSEVAKANLDATIREMEAGESTITADDIALNIRGGKQREKVAADLGSLTTKLQDLNREFVVQGERKSSADGVILGQISDMYDKNQKVHESDIQTALEKAGGIDSNGATKVRAKAKSNIVKLYMENVEAVNSILSNEGYEPQEQLDIIQKGELRGGEDASEFHVYSALERTLTVNGNNWSAQKIIDHAATKGMESMGNGKFRGYNDAGQLVELTDEEVSNRRDFQQMVLQYLNKSPLKVDYMTATMRSMLETGTFINNPTGKPKSEDLILSETNMGKYDQNRIVDADVDVLQRMVQVYRNPSNRTNQNKEARQKLLNSILQAQANPQINAKIKDRERGVMNTLVSYLDDGDTRPESEKESTMYYIRDTNGDKLYSRVTADGKLERITADTEGAQRDTIIVRAPQNYTINNLRDS